MSPGDQLLYAIAETVCELFRSEKRLYSVPEAAKYLGLSDESIHDLIGKGKLNAVRLTRKIQLDVRDLDRLIDSAKLNKAAA